MKHLFPTLLGFSKLILLAIGGMVLMACAPRSSNSTDSFTKLCPKFIQGTYRKPSLVEVLVQVQTCDEKPIYIAGLSSSNFQLTQDINDNSGPRAISLAESKQNVFPLKQSLGSVNLLLLDMSPSVTNSSETVSKLAEAAKGYVDAIFKASAQAITGTETKLGIYWFDGSPQIQPLVEFTADKDRILKDLGLILSIKGSDNSTNLRGAIVEGSKTIRNARNQLKLEKNLAEALATMVVFTDGTDQANRIDERAVQQELLNARSESIAIQTIGLSTSEVDNRTLRAYGPDGAEVASNTSSLASAFTRQAEVSLQKANSFYSIRYCSPLRRGKAILGITVVGNFGQGKVDDLEFVADNFDSGECSPDTLEGKAVIGSLRPISVAVARPNPLFVATFPPKPTQEWIVSVEGLSPWNLVFDALDRDGDPTGTGRQGSYSSPTYAFTESDGSKTFQFFGTNGTYWCIFARTATPTGASFLNGQTRFRANNTQNSQALGRSCSATLIK
jgi:hypothetical protein